MEASVINFISRKSGTAFRVSTGYYSLFRPGNVGLYLSPTIFIIPSKALGLRVRSLPDSVYIDAHMDILGLSVSCALFIDNRISLSSPDIYKVS